MKAMAQLAMAELGHCQEKQKKRYDVTVRPWSFEVGQKVILLLPPSENKLLMDCEGPYEVTEKMGNVNDRICIPWKGVHLDHVNLLKEWREWEADACHVCHGQTGMRRG